MSCNTPEFTKAQFISVLNSFAAAAKSGDANLVAFSTSTLQGMVEQLTFKEEEAEEVETQVVDS